MEEAEVTAEAMVEVTGVHPIEDLLLIFQDQEGIGIIIVDDLDIIIRILHRIIQRSDGYSYFFIFHFSLRLLWLQKPFMAGFLS